MSSSLLNLDDFVTVLLAFWSKERGTWVSLGLSDAVSWWWVEGWEHDSSLELEYVYFWYICFGLLLRSQDSLGTDFALKCFYNLRLGYFARHHHFGFSKDWCFLFVFSVSFCFSMPALSLSFHCKTNFCCVPKWRQDQLDFFFWFAQVADEYMFSLEENKKSKGRRQPLSKLPRHHPLVLQDCVSDDGKCCLLSLPGRKQLSALGLWWFKREARLRAKGGPVA